MLRNHKDEISDAEPEMDSFADDKEEQKVEEIEEAKQAPKIALEVD